ncbi:MAG: gliding motility-associated C-terminal domain-containing protein [Agriterribacter sp.]
MRINVIIAFLLSLFFLNDVCFSQTVSFSAPDTVCVTQPVSISNTSTGASAYYWNFCVADLLNTPPTGTNLGNPNGALNGPVFSDFVESNGNFFVFVVNHYDPTGLVRLDFGNSLLNTPTAVNLGNFGNTMRRRPEGIQVIQDNGKWYAFVVAGDRDLGDTPQLIRFAFGTNIQNSTPAVSDLGDIGNMNQPLDLYMFKENNEWHGFTVNKNGSLTRFHFSNGLDNPPVAQNYPLGLNYPTGVNVIKDNGKFYVFVTVAVSNSIARLDFGNSLLNNPTVVDLGDPGSTQTRARDIYIMRFCNAIVGFVVNGPSDGPYPNQLVRLDFHNNIESIPTGVSLGNIGDLNFPHSISKLFRVDDKVYSFITNVSNNTITRLEFPNCTNSNLSSSALKDPPSIKYNTPGTYNINLTIDDGLPSQSSFCKQVVVVPEPTHTPSRTIILQDGESIKIGSGNTSKTYEWNTGAKVDSITVNAEGIYIVKTSGYGCENVDTIIIKKQVTTPAVSFNIPDTICVTQSVNITNTSSGASSYYWNFCVADINKAPTGTNFGNVGGLLAAPVFMDYVFFNNNYYGFLTDHNPGALIRLDFGNSLLNTPTAVSLGNFGGIIPTGPGAEGIQMVYNEGKWYAIIVGGYDLEGSTPRIIKVDFGANPTNTSPIVTNWGNIGNMYQPIDLHVFKEGNNWFGLTVNAESNTLTRFNFTSSFDNVPTGTNLGNVGGAFAYPTGVYAIENNGDWKVFVVNGGDRTRSSGVYSLVRLDFGSSLLNTPTAVNLGNPGNLLQHPRDISIMKSCDQIIGFAVNGHFNNSDIIKLDFGNDLSAVPEAGSLGNIGNLSFPHSLSKLFRDGKDLYCFITNSDNNSLVRLQFTGCTNSSLQSSTAQNPPLIKYDSAGVYHINLTIDDGLPSQSSYCRQVVVVAEPVHTPIKTIIIKQGESIKIGSGNASGVYKWNTTSDNKDSITVQNEGLYYVETNGYGCSNIDSFLVVFKEEADFSYQQDACNPLQLTFKNETPDGTVIGWDFGNGTTTTSDSNPTISYDSFGSYNVTLTVKNISGNTLQVTKQIPVTIQTDSLIITNDTTICAGSSIQLNAISALNYCWYPAETLNNSSIANPVAAPLTSTTYFLNTLITGQNIITNGDFSDGNISFGSEYKYVENNTTEGEYFVGNSSLTWNPHLIYNCGDHSGTGNMLLVNGSPEDNKVVWTESVSVLPNTNYAFSTWIESHFQDNPAQLAFFINGIAIGTPITASLPICNWTQFYATWNSGNSTSAIISIVNKNTVSWGNDFALDDISFAPVFIKRDSVRINIERPAVKANNDTTACAGTIFQLNALGNFSSYSWTPTSSLSNGNIYNPLATPAQTTQYIVTATSSNGCIAKDTVVLNVKSIPVFDIIDDTLICKAASVQLHVSTGFIYSWSPSETLDNAFVPNPVATPFTETTYKVLVTDASTGCSSSDSVKINVRPYPVFSASGDAEICAKSNFNLHASGGDTYGWSPSISLDDPQSPNPVAQPLNTTQYTVHISESTCNYDTSINVNIIVHPTPVVVAQKSNDINCEMTTAQLNASGASSYIWTPAGHLDNPAKSNPIASIDTTTMFIVKGTTVNGCSSSDSLTVKVTAEGSPLYLVPNAFTPNNDGINDCLSIKKWGNIQLQEFSIYNRWGERVFYTTNPLACWDGTYKGQPQNIGTFVYVIRGKTFCGSIMRKGLVTLIR